MKTIIHIFSVITVSLIMCVNATAGRPYKTYIIHFTPDRSAQITLDGNPAIFGEAGMVFTFIGASPTNETWEGSGCWEATLDTPDDPPSIMWQAFLFLRPTGTAKFLELESTRSIKQEDLDSENIPKWNHAVKHLQNGGWEKLADGTCKLWLYEE